MYEKNQDSNGENIKGEGKEVNGTFCCKRELFKKKKIRIKATNSQVLNTFIFDYS